MRCVLLFLIPEFFIIHSCKFQFKATLAALEADLEDLEESVKYVLYPSSLPSRTNILRRIVESTDARMFGLDDAEVQKRRRYVGHVRKEIEVGSCFQTFALDSCL